MKKDNSLVILERSKTAVDANIIRHESELAKMRSVSIALGQAIAAYQDGAGLAPDIKPIGKAPAGALKQAILGVLIHATAPLGNLEVRDAIRATGYAYSLGPMHVGKTLAKLHAARKVKRDGKNSGAKYTLAKT